MILQSLLDLRASASPGTTTLGQPAGWLFDAFGMVPSEAGVLVSERNAVGLSAVWTCVNIRAGLLASLPFNLYSVDVNGRRKLAINRREHSILHDRTSPEDTSYQFRHKMAVNWLLWGNAYALIEWDGRAALRYLWPYHPTHVRVVYGTTRGDYHYVVTGQLDGKYAEKKVLPEDMLHLRGLSYEGVQGISTIQNYRRGLGMAMAMEIFESNFYKRGAMVSGVLTHPGRLSLEAAQNLRKSFAENYEGAQNAGKTIMLEEGAKFQPLSMPQSDAEFIASKRMSRAEIAGLFRIPTMLVPGADDKAATYASSEIFNRQLVDYTLRDDCTMWEHEFNSKLFPQGDHASIFDLHDLLRGDSLARAQYWAARWRSGSISANEIRDEEGENPISAPSGNKYYVPINYVDANAPPPPPPKPNLALPDKDKNDDDPDNPDKDGNGNDGNDNKDRSRTSPGQSPANPPANPRQKPGKSGANHTGFRLLFSNLVAELKSWESFHARRAATKLQGTLINPLAAELLAGEADSVILAGCADALAQRIRAIEAADLEVEFDRLVAQIEAAAR